MVYLRPLQSSLVHAGCLLIFFFFFFDHSFNLNPFFEKHYGAAPFEDYLQLFFLFFLSLWVISNKDS